MIISKSCVDFIEKLTNLATSLGINHIDFSKLYNVSRYIDKEFQHKINLKIIENGKIEIQGDSNNLFLFIQDISSSKIWFRTSKITSCKISEKNEILIETDTSVYLLKST